MFNTSVTSSKFVKSPLLQLQPEGLFLVIISSELCKKKNEVNLRVKLKEEKRIMKQNPLEFILIKQKHNILL